MNIKGAVALVTGGRSGIGAAISKALAEVGVHVITAQRGPDSIHEHIEVDLLPWGPVTGIPLWH